MTIKQLDHLNLTVGNFKETVAWYARVFGFELVEEGVQDGHPWGVIKGGEALLCIYENPALDHKDRFDRARAGLHGLNHFALRIEDLGAWEAVIDQEKVDVKYGGRIDWPHSYAWYVDDPTGYEIEVAYWTDGQPTFG